MKTKSLSILASVVAVLCCAVYLHSAEQKGTPADIAGSLFVPEMYGSVEEVFQGKDNRLVIHIQDAHTDGKAQENIAAILDKLLLNYNINSIWIEGGSGVIDTSLFASFPVEKTKEVLSKLYMNEGFVSGPEYFSINSKKFVHLFGAEDMQLYLDNVKAFKDVWADRQTVKTAIDGMREGLQALKNEVYPAELKAIDAKKTAFEKGEITFTAYCEFLKEACEKQGIDTKRFTDFNQLFVMFAVEKGIDFDKIEPERIALIEQLADKLNREKLTQLTQNSLLFRVGRMTPVNFYGALKAMADGEKIALGKNLEAYVAYLNASKTVDRVKANRDREMLEDELYAKLCGTAEAKRVCVLSKEFLVMEKLLSLRLSRRDLDFYLKNKKACAPTTIEGGLKEEMQKGGLDAGAMKASLLTPAVDMAGKFYDIAVKRDDQLVKNLLDGMNAAGKDKAILVSGGFHTEGIKRILREKGISYVVILPKVSPVYNETKYASLMLDEGTPYLDFFKKRKAPDALPGSIGMASVHERAEAAIPPETRFGKDARGENFTLKQLADLPSAAVCYGYISLADVNKQWLEALQKRIGEALDIEKGVFKTNIANIDGTTVFAPIRISDNELYVPVRFGSTTMVLSFTKGDRTAPVEALAKGDRLRMVGGPAVVEGYTVQAMDVLGAGALNPAAVVPALSKDAPEDMKAMGDSVNPKVAAGDKRFTDNGYWKQPFAPDRAKSPILDFSRPELMVNAAQALREWRTAHPGAPVGLVTRNLAKGETREELIKKLHDVLGLTEADYDVIYTPAPGETGLAATMVKMMQDKMLEIDKTKTLDPEKDIVIVTPDETRYGMAIDNKINGTPLIKPALTPTEDQYVSLRKILLCADLVLMNDGNIDQVIKDILDGKIPGLAKILAAEGITDEATVKDLIYAPQPVQAPNNTVGKEVAAYVEYLRAA